jgi:vanillate O-demethylase ferredoxin subunit
LSRNLTVRVERIVPQTPEILAFELVHPWGGRLPAFAAGAHVSVHTPGGFARQYSLVNPPLGSDASERYVIGVKREPASRGGSAALHERVRPGDLLCVSAPHNTFTLQAHARRHLLLAGGIGLTPLLAMARELRHRGADFSLCVFARSREHLAFADALRALGPAVQLHFDDPADPHKLDLRALLAQPEAGTHVYACGPAGFMAAVQRAAADWDESCLHREYFAAPDGGAGARSDLPFELALARSGVQVQVGADETAVDALHQLGIEVPTSCGQGICGTCTVDWLDGQPDHRDHCLSGSERRTRIALCCSRAVSRRLVIDL